MTDYLGWLGNAVLLAGVWALGHRWRHAFLLTFVGEAIWCVACVPIGRWDMLFICAAFGLMALRNWWLWGREADGSRASADAPEADTEASAPPEEEHP